MGDPHRLHAQLRVLEAELERAKGGVLMSSIDVERKHSSSTLIASITTPDTSPTSYGITAKVPVPGTLYPFKGSGIAPGAFDLSQGVAYGYAMATSEDPRFPASSVFSPGVDGPGVGGPGVDGSGVDGSGVDGPGVGGSGVDAPSVSGVERGDGFWVSTGMWPQSLSIMLTSPAPLAQLEVACVCVERLTVRVFGHSGGLAGTWPANLVGYAPLREGGHPSTDVFRLRLPGKPIARVELVLNDAPTLFDHAVIHAVRLFPRDDWEGLAAMKNSVGKPDGRRDERKEPCTKDDLMLSLGVVGSGGGSSGHLAPDPLAEPPARRLSLVAGNSIQDIRRIDSELSMGSVGIPPGTPDAAESSLGVDTTLPIIGDSPDGRDTGSSMSDGRSKPTDRSVFIPPLDTRLSPRNPVEARVLHPDALSPTARRIKADPKVVDSAQPIQTKASKRQVRGSLAGASPAFDDSHSAFRSRSLSREDPRAVSGGGPGPISGGGPGPMASNHAISDGPMVSDHAIKPASTTSASAPKPAPTGAGKKPKRRNSLKRRSSKVRLVFS